jgi:starch phosphorylase
VESSGDRHRFRAHVQLGELDPDAVRVELFAEGRQGAAPERAEALRCEPLPGATHAFVYRGSVPAERPASHWTVRVVPHHPDARVPLEAGWIRWPD